MSSNTRSKKTEKPTRTSERNRKSLPASGSEKTPSRTSGRRKEHTPDKLASSDSRDESGIDLVESLLGEESANTAVDAEVLGQKLFEQLSRAMKKPHTPAPEPEDASTSEPIPKLKVEEDSGLSEAGLPTPKPTDEKIRAEDLEAARDLVHFFEAPRYLSEKSDGDAPLAANGELAIATTSIEVTTQDASQVDTSPTMKVTTNAFSTNKPVISTGSELGDPALSDSGLASDLQFTITTVAAQEPDHLTLGSGHGTKKPGSSKSETHSPKLTPPVLVADDGIENENSSVETPKNTDAAETIDIAKQALLQQNGLVSNMNIGISLDETDPSKASGTDDLLTPVTSSLEVDSIADTTFPPHDGSAAFLDLSSKAASDIFMPDGHLPLLSGGINPLDISLNMDVDDVPMTDGPKSNPSSSKKAPNPAEEEEYPIDCCAFYRRKSSRAHTAIDYVSLNEGSRAPFKAAGDSTQHPFVEPIGHMQFAPDDFPRMIPELLDVDFFEQGHGFIQPIVIPASCNPRPHSLREIHLLTNGMRDDGTIDVEKVSKVEKFPALFKKDKKDATPKSRSAIRVATSDQVTVSRRPTDDADALGMVIPFDLTVRRVAEFIGFDEKVDVLDVLSQSQDKKTWTFVDWVDYFETPQKDRVKNVISQEFSHTRLAEAVRRPAIVEALDLADQVWPEDMRTTFPKVQLYCLMGVAGSYTDFHIDFGGSSVFYHVITGKKTFFFVPPSKHNLTKYEAWSMMPDQNSTWYPSLLSNDNSNGENHVRRVDLQAGDTMLIPSGWIHAVLTPEDALVIGGNFLTRLSIDRQIKIAEIEKDTNVPAKFRYPQFQKVMWFTALDYLQKDPLPEELFDDDDWDLLIMTEEVQMQRTYVGYSQYELDGLPVLADYLLRTALIVMNYITEGITQEKRKRVQNSIPKHVQDPLSTIQLFGRWMAWKRGDVVVPYWARRSWNPGEGFTGIGSGDKKSSQKGRKSRGESMDLGKGGSPREGLRKSKPSAKLRDSMPGSPSIVVTPSRQVSFSSDPKAAADKIKSFAKKSGKRAISPASAVVGTPTSTKARKISAGSSSQSTPVSTQKRQGSDTPGPGRPRSGSSARRGSISQASATKPATLMYTPDGKPLSQAVINKGLAENHRLAESIRNKYAFSSSPKNSILGPKRTACDECRRQKIACKHKNEVALAEAEIMKELTKSPKSGNAFETPSKPAQGSPKAQATVPGSSKDAARGVNYQISKNGRPVACEACKRSRRRCIHNGQEGFPPAKRRSQKDKGTPETDGANETRVRRKKNPTSTGAAGEGLDEFDSGPEFSDELSTLSSLDSEALQDDDSAPLDQIILETGAKGIGKGFLGRSSPGTEGKKGDFLNLNFGGSMATDFDTYTREGGLRGAAPVGRDVSGNVEKGVDGITTDDSRTGTKRRLPEEFAGFRGTADDGDDADASVFAATAATAAANSHGASTGSPTKRARVDATTPALFSPPEEGVYGEYFAGAGDEDGVKKKESGDKGWESNDLPTMFIPPTGIPPGA
ncbi:hypothetical protein ABW20_dc0105991 [Dactylellina cionopaga]|nr:hypothetical protein ABW20_dc0105991 [Dactylellina cionopaga]